MARFGKAPPPSASPKLSQGEALKQARSILFATSDQERASAKTPGNISHELAKIISASEGSIAEQLAYDVIYYSHHNERALRVLAEALLKVSWAVLVSVFVAVVKKFGDRDRKSFSRQQEFD